MFQFGAGIRPQRWDVGITTETRESLELLTELSSSDVEFAWILMDFAMLCPCPILRF